MIFDGPGQGAPDRSNLRARVGDLVSRARPVPPVAEPDAAKARAALRSLDGARISQLAADDERGQVLPIGGGNEGRFVVDCLVDVDEHGYHLVDPDGTPEEISVVTGGQRASCPGDRVVSEALAADALVHFVATGLRAESPIWRQDF